MRTVQAFIGVPQTAGLQNQAIQAQLHRPRWPQQRPKRPTTTKLADKRPVYIKDVGQPNILVNGSAATDAAKPTLWRRSSRPLLTAGRLHLIRYARTDGYDRYQTAIAIRAKRFIEGKINTKADENVRLFSSPAGLFRTGLHMQIACIWLVNPRVKSWSSSSSRLANRYPIIHAAVHSCRLTSHAR